MACSTLKFLGTYNALVLRFCPSQIVISCFTPLQTLTKINIMCNNRIKYNVYKIPLVFLKLILYVSYILLYFKFFLQKLLKI